MSAQQIEYSIAHLNLLCSILLLYRAFSFRSLIKTIRVKVFLCATYTASRAPAVIAVLFRRMNRYVGNLSPRSAFVQVFGRRHDEPSTRCGGRRLKSAKARSRGKFGTGGAAGAMGI
jgi:hypothetical protein